MCAHLGQLTLRGEAEAVDGVGPAVGPLAKLLRCLGEGHVGGDGAVDDGLLGEKKMHSNMSNSKESGRLLGQVVFGANSFLSEK